MIRSKAQMYALYHAGAFGNRTRGWDSWGAWVADGRPCAVNVRSRTPGGVFTFCAGMTPREVRDVCETYGEGAYVLGEATPDHLLTLNAEFVRREGGPPWGELWYSRAQLTMRRALREAPEWAEGLRAKCLCQGAMDPSSWDDFNELIDSHPWSAIEFSCFSRFVGVVPGRNTIFWEVRDY